VKIHLLQLAGARNGPGLLQAHHLRRQRAPGGRGPALSLSLLLSFSLCRLPLAGQCLSGGATAASLGRAACT